MKLGQILIRKRLISQAQLDQLLNQQAETHKKLGDLLVEQGLIPPQELFNALSEQHWRACGVWLNVG